MGESTDFEAMGLSIRTLRWRYTLWLRWDGRQLAPRWDGEPVGEELYDHAMDAGDDTDLFDNANLAALPEHEAMKKQLREQLRMGWRPSRPANDWHDRSNAE